MSKNVTLIGKEFTEVKKDSQKWNNILKKEGVQAKEVEKIIQKPTKNPQVKKFFVKTK